MQSFDAPESRVAVIALDINKNAENFSDYAKLSAAEKIARIEQHIEAICADMQVKEANAMWVVTWREYGITDALQDKGLPPHIRRLFKEKMQALTVKYPQLKIVGGTLSTKKHFHGEERFKRLQQYYADHAWAEEEVKRLQRYYTNAISVEKKEEEFSVKVPTEENREIIKSRANNKESQQEFDVIRNTCYLFDGNKIWRHDKIIPINESAKEDEHALFQSGNQKNPTHASTYTILHPITGDPITIGVEICLEHDVAVLKRSSEEKPYLHLVMSDTTVLNPNNTFGQYVLQLDSRFKPTPILSRNEDALHIPIHYYQVSLETDYQLKGPLQPIFPFMNRVIEKLDEIILSFPEKKEVLMTVREKFSRALFDPGYHPSNDYPDRVYQMLAAALKNDDLKAGADHVFFQQRSLKEKLKELKVMIKAERRINPTGIDYVSIVDALPLDKVAKFDVLMEKGEYERALFYMDDDFFQHKKFSLSEVIPLLSYMMNADMTESDIDKHCERLFQNIQPIIMDPIEQFNNETLLNGFCIENRLDMLKRIMPYCKQQINVLSANGDTALHAAIKARADVSLINYLLDNGASASIKNSDNKTAVELIKEQDDPNQQLLERLLEANPASSHYKGC